MMLSMENIGQWPWLVKLGVYAMLSGMLLLGGYMILIRPNIESLHGLFIDQASLKEQFEMKQSKTGRVADYKVQLAQMKAHFESMLKKLPAKNEMPALLEDLSRTGIAGGLTFQLFAPKPAIAHDFYVEVPIDIKVLGNYHNLAMFVSRIAQMQRLVTLHDLEISVVTPNNQVANALPPTGSDTLEMHVTAKIYHDTPHTTTERVKS